MCPLSRYLLPIRNLSSTTFLPIYSLSSVVFSLRVIFSRSCAFFYCRLVPDPPPLFLRVVCTTRSPFLPITNNSPFGSRLITKMSSVIGPISGLGSSSSSCCPGSNYNNDRKVSSCPSASCRYRLVY